MSLINELTAEEKIDLEKQRAEAKIAKLKEQILNNLKTIDELKNVWVSAKTEKEAQETFIRMEEVKEHIRLLEKMIDELTGQDNAVIQQILYHQAAEHLKNLIELERKASQVHKNLLPHHKVLMDGLNEINLLRNKVYSLKSSAKYYSCQLTKENLIKLEKEYEQAHELDVSRKYMNPLLVESGSVYKTW